jgi:hypothetical protein
MGKGLRRTCAQAKEKAAAHGITFDWRRDTTDQPRTAGLVEAFRVGISVYRKFPLAAHSGKLFGPCQQGFANALAHVLWKNPHGPPFPGPRVGSDLHEANGSPVLLGDNIPDA